jgi:heterotetrameric sarcosine oxidase gamma subunit
MSELLAPVKHSPLHWVLTSIGANLSRRAGWEVVHDFGDVTQEVSSARSQVGLSDFSFTTKWDIQGADLGDALLQVSPGKVLETNRAMVCETGFLSRLSPNHAMWVADLPDNSVTLSRLVKHASERCLHLIDRTSGFGHLILCGPKSQSVLRRLVSLDIRESSFPHLSCAWAPMAGVRILLVRNDRRDVLAYEVIVSREYTEYLWTTIMETGQMHRIRPLGFDSMRLLGAE